MSSGGGDAGGEYLVVAELVAGDADDPRFVGRDVLVDRGAGVGFVVEVPLVAGEWSCERDGHGCSVALRAASRGGSGSSVGRAAVGLCGSVEPCPCFGELQDDAGPADLGCCDGGCELGDLVEDGLLSFFYGGHGRHRMTAAGGVL